MVQACWAFGPDGFPDLKVFLYGDFTHDGRYTYDNAFLCKDGMEEDGTPRVRTLRPDDYELWNLVNANMDMIGACPATQIMEGMDLSRG